LRTVAAASTNHYQDDQVKEDEIGESSSTHSREENDILNYDRKKLNEGNYIKDLGLDVGIILNFDFRW
jgi:hypothetical protein